MIAIDILKVIVVLIIFGFLSMKGKPLIQSKYYWLMQAGLYLLLFGGILDFTDEIKALDNTLIVGRNAPYHDILEDQIGDTLGFTLFGLGAIWQIVRMKNRD